jgi:hypothetical protein
LCFDVCDARTVIRDVSGDLVVTTRMDNGTLTVTVEGGPDYRSAAH